jgi:hypothetical protein
LENHGKTDVCFRIYSTPDKDNIIHSIRNKRRMTFNDELSSNGKYYLNLTDEIELREDDMSMNT